jgi:L-2-hydroxyglutarate oxidase LhgO
VEEIDCAVIGAGVVGLAIARSLTLRGRDTILIEQERQFGFATSSRNSEVIHAGIYYPPGSIKAKTCVEGRALLYAYCARRGIAHRRCGKLIVATSEGEIAGLERLRNVAVANGVTDLQMMSGAEARALEPALHAEAALHSPSTGIIDSHGFMTALAGDLENAGGIIALASPIAGLRPGPGGIVLLGATDGEPLLRARTVINSAGLGAVALAERTEGLAPGHVPRLYLAKGSYFAVAGRSPFSRLIYPLPEPGGLGTHLTLDLAGTARLGPDVEWVDAIDYQVDPARSAGFAASARRFWPDLRDDALAPAYAGVRPKIAGAGEAAVDFMVSGPLQHGIPGLINLFGIESPGLTASLALAELVASEIALAPIRAP